MAFVAFNFQNCAKSSFQLRESLASNGVSGLSVYPTSCREYYENGSCQDGPYKIDPDGNGIGINAFTVWCDMKNYGRTLVAFAPNSGYTTIPEVNEIKDIANSGRLSDSKISMLLNLTQNSQHNNVVVNLTTAQDKHTVSLNSNSTSNQGEYIVSGNSNGLCDSYDTGVDGSSFTDRNYWKIGNGTGDGFFGYLDNQTGINPYIGFVAQLPATTDEACNIPGPKNAENFLAGSLWIVEDPNPHAACEQPPGAIDGNWTTWAAWTDSTVCDDSCSKTQSAVRTCENPVPSATGSNCDLLDGGHSIKYQQTYCEVGEGSCQNPPNSEDGNWTPWTNWTDSTPCDAYCNRTQTANRTCTNPSPVYKGKDCSDLDGGNDTMVKNIMCQPGEGLCAPLPIHGGWTTWSGWVDDTQCDDSCIKQQKRERTCSAPTPQNGGNDCANLDGGEGVDNRLASCQPNEGQCVGNPQIDGGWSNWSPARPHTSCTVDCTKEVIQDRTCLLYTSPSPRDQRGSRMPSSA